VGKALMAQVMKEAMARDLHSVYAYVRRDNKVGRKYLSYIVIHILY
jgi:ribosomal protein S18 acetylase RimI-like enzyme